MTGFLALGFLIGMQHALEADHLAAMGAMIEDEPGSGRGLVLRGVAWGLGHTITLFAICAAVILTGLNLTEQHSAALEFCVGVMLVTLGLDVLRRLWKKRIHFHLHTHHENCTHIHAHSHESATLPHTSDPHLHRHTSGFPGKALAIGLMHGGAGSAGLLALAVASTQNPLMALGYVVLFGLGSICGMTTLTLIVTWPLGVVERNTHWIHKGLSLGAALFAIYLGTTVMMTNVDLMRGTA